MSDHEHDEGAVWCPECRQVFPAESAHGRLEYVVPLDPALVDHIERLEHRADRSEAICRIFSRADELEAERNEWRDVARFLAEVAKALAGGYHFWLSAQEIRDHGCACDTLDAARAAVAKRGD